MWKKNFILKVDAHPEDGLQTVHVSMDGDYWLIHGLGSDGLRLPNDDNVLAQIASVCEQIINHPDNPLNATRFRFRCPDARCYVSDFYNIGENLFFCFNCSTKYRYHGGGSYTPING